MNTRSKAFEENFYNWHIVSKNRKKSNKYDYQSAIKHLHKNYLKPSSAISFSGINQLYNYYNKIIPVKDIKHFLSKDDSYTLHTRSFKKNYNPSYIRYKSQQFQMDLIDVGNLSYKNDGVKYILTMICCFTKKAWVVPIKSKKSDVVLNAFKTVFKTIDKPPRSVLMDLGGEFALVRKWCDDKSIRVYLPYSSFHGAFIERFNQSIKRRIYRWMDSNKTERYILHLPKLLQGYNNSVHSSIGISPNLAWKDKATHPQIRERLQEYYNKFKPKKPNFNIGDIIRIKRLPKGSFSKGYDIQNNQELFKIKKVITNLPVPMYQIKSLEDSSEGVIKGKFYGHEIVKVDNK